MFDSNDFCIGTMLMTNDQVGRYVRLLCIQADKGRVQLSDMQKLSDNDILVKFKVDSEGLYYNVRLEKELKAEQKKSEPKLKPPKVERVALVADNKPSTYANCMNIYNQFVILRTTIPANINGRDGKSLKGIIETLRKNETVKQAEDGVEKAFRVILEKYDDWSDYHKKQIKISQIEYNLTNIINDIKNGLSKTRSEQRNDHYKGLQSEFREDARRIIRENNANTEK